MSTFVLSDTHLAFSNDKPMSIFGTRWLNHENKIKQGWIEAGITDNDTTIISGDISWAMRLYDSYLDFKFIDELKGTKIIGRGNHDLWWDSDTKVLKMFEEKNLTTLKLLRNNAVDIDEYIICGTRGWYPDEKNAPSDTNYQKLVAREKIRLELSLSQGKKIQADSRKEIIVFFHFPPVFNDYVCAEFIEILHRFDIKRCYYGHIHSVYDIPPRREFEDIVFEITSADYLNFKPIKI